ncbi:unnamed protein product, partial [Mesorhabditis spiculigera]
MAISGLFKLGLLGVLLSTIPVYYRYQDAENIQCRPIELKVPPALNGKLAPNDKLSKVEHVLEDRLDGPESLAAIGETLYTGLYDGRVVKIVDGRIVSEIKLTKAKDCGNYDNEPKCGRPLGIRRKGLTGEKFLVIDAYRGIEEVDFADGSHRLIFKAQTLVGGKASRFLNDLDFLNDDEIVVTDTSTTYGRREFMYPIIQHRDDGRLFMLNLKTGQSKVLANNLVFANGVQVLPDKTAVLVAELGAARILKVTIGDTPRVEVWADNLPGLPDNIRLEGDHIWVGLSLLRYEGAESLLDKLAPYPWLRQLILDIVPSKLWLSLVPLTRPPHSMVLKMDLKGNIVSTLQDPKGTKLGSISEVLETEKFLYFGSFDAPYIGRLDKKNL